MPHGTNESRPPAFGMPRVKRSLALYYPPSRRRPAVSTTQLRTPCSALKPSFHKWPLRTGTLVHPEVVGAVDRLIRPRRHQEFPLRIQAFRLPSATCSTSTSRAGAIIPPTPSASGTRSTFPRRPSGKPTARPRNVYWTASTARRTWAWSPRFSPSGLPVA
jgi:hypothetical protein